MNEGGEISVVEPYVFENLLENPGFELGGANGTAPGWTLLQTNSSVTNAVYHNGQYSLKIEDLATTLNGGARSGIIAAEPGDRFRAEAYVRVEKGSATLYIEFVNTAGQHHSYAVPWTNGATSGKWVLAIVEGTVPEGATGVRMLPYSGGSSTCVCYFDDISLMAREDIPVKQQFGPVQTIPDVVLNKVGQSAAVGRTQSGTQESYFFANGAPGTFYALDAITGQMRFSQQVTGANIVWAMTFAPDGNVYFATSETGKLYRYNPNEQRLDDLGVNPSGRTVWDIEATPDGRYIYGAVYPKGKIFKYDTQTNTFSDLGTIRQGKEYVRGLTVTDTYVYAGLGTYAGTEPRVVVRLDQQTGDKFDIPVPASGTFVNDVHVYGGKLFVTSDSLYVLDETTFQNIDNFAYSRGISPPSPDSANLIYYNSGSKVYSYDLITDERLQVGTLPALSTTGMLALDWVHPAEGEFAGKNVLSGVTLYGDGFLFDPVSGTSVQVNLEVAGSPVETHSMKAGPDGKLYIGGFSQGVSVYDTYTRHYIAQQFHTLQMEGTGFLNGKVYMGMYGGAQIYEYDPNLPWIYGVAAGNNPHRVYDIQEQTAPTLLHPATTNCSSARSRIMDTLEASLPFITLRITRGKNTKILNWSTTRA